VGILEYVDPKGRKPTAYTKIMKKYKVSQEQVLEEAGKMSMNIDAIHFAEPEQDSKRGRPKEKAAKEPKEPKGAKGRPKKAKKVLQIEGDEDDLFATLVADANSAEDDEEVVIAPKKKAVKSDEEKEAERIALAKQKEAEKALKEEQRLKEKAEKEAKLAAEKLEKEAKKEAERLAREAKKADEEAAKKAKEEQRLKDKAEKEAKLAAEKEAKKSKPAAAKKAAEPVEDDGEPDVVKKIEFEGKKYLKSKKTGIIYDYNEYVKNGEQVVVGHWNESKNKIDFSDAGEESEEEYEN
jgi:colicin import membrane protein